jgi:hypothetical protein
MKALNKQGFKLPYIGTDGFKELRRAGVNYERGRFSIGELNNVENVKLLLSEILGEEIAFTQTCLICGKEFLCSECKYYDSCPSRDLPFHCICKSCSKKNKLYDRYVERDKRRMRRITPSS